MVISSVSEWIYFHFESPSELQENRRSPRCQDSTSRLQTCGFNICLLVENKARQGVASASGAQLLEVFLFTQRLGL
jgi:hypothetical protein